LIVAPSLAEIIEVFFSLLILAIDLSRLVAERSPLAFRDSGNRVLNSDVPF